MGVCGRSSLASYLGCLHEPAEVLESQRPCTCFALAGGGTGVAIACLKKEAQSDYRANCIDLLTRKVCVLIYVLGIEVEFGGGRRT